MLAVLGVIRGGEDSGALCGVATESGFVVVAATGAAGVGNAFAGGVGDGDVAAAFASASGGVSRGRSGLSVS